MSLDKIEADTVRPLEGQTVKLTLPSGSQCEGVIRSLRVGTKPSPNLRAPFSFIIEVPRAQSTQEQGQGTVRIEHASLGEVLEVFAVPLQPTSATVAPWEVVFG